MLRSIFSKFIENVIGKRIGINLSHFWARYRPEFKRTMPDFDFVAIYSCKRYHLSIKLLVFVFIAIHPRQSVEARDYLMVLSRLLAS